jgi:hypothetical protein
MSKRTKKILLVVGLIVGGLFLLYKVAEMFSPGTLGSFDDRRFRLKKSDFVSVFDSIPERQIPDKWKESAMSIEHTYEFIHENTCVYLKEYPEEMYFVSYNGNSKFSAISIRSVYTRNRWFTQRDLDDSERERIENRFDAQIIRQIEDATGTKAERVNN